MVFGMSFHFQNVVLFRNVFSFSECVRFCVKNGFQPIAQLSETTRAGLFKPIDFENYLAVTLFFCQFAISINKVLND